MDLFNCEKKYNLDGPDVLWYYWIAEISFESKGWWGGSVTLWVAFLANIDINYTLIDDTQYEFVHKSIQSKSLPSYTDDELRAIWGVLGVIVNFLRGKSEA